MTPIAAALVAVGVLALSAVVLVVCLARSRRRGDSLRRELVSARELAERRELHHQRLMGETQYLAAVRIPALATRLAHPHVSVPGLHHAEFAGTEVEVTHTAVLDQLTTMISAERERVDEGAQAVMRSATTFIQAGSNQIREAIENMQNRYDLPGLSPDLRAVDAINERNLRRIQGTGVLCGATAGLTRQISHLGDVIVAAQSRVPGYDRVRVSSELREPLAMVAHAVEPLAIIVTELLANALETSRADLDVHVVLRKAGAGANVIINDAGRGLDADAKPYVARMLSRKTPVLLTELGDPPRAGFATIGRVVEEHGFSVSVDDPSPYGGVHAVVLIPPRLLTLLNEEEHPMSASAPLPLGALSQSADAEAQADGHSEMTLPRRQRRRPSTESPAPAEEAASTQTPQEVRLRWGAVQSGTISGRAAAYNNGEGNQS
ncbi:ATP-binding protein [Streptomyces niveus]|uniref:ATP-binding protein n=1 Tax=Streptomyces niveus TaxID=193462 RepID=UPI00364E26F9